MTDPSGHNPTARFTGLADLYARCRPDYPAAAVAYILDRCGLGAGGQLVDVGCGTGISSRLFAAAGLGVIGIEPNPDMLARAEAEPWQDPGSEPVYCKGRAESTGLPDASADAVLAAQAFHWFEPEPAFREFHRILRPRGWTVLIWNEADDGDPCTAAYRAVVGSPPEAPAVETPHRLAGNLLLSCPLFEDARRDVFHHEQALTEEGLLGRAFSTSYAPRDPDAAARYEADLRSVFARWQQDGRVVLQYETAVFTARRRSSASSNL